LYLNAQLLPIIEAGGHPGAMCASRRRGNLAGAISPAPIDDRRLARRPTAATAVAVVVTRGVRGVVVPELHAELLERVAQRLVAVQQRTQGLRLQVRAALGGPVGVGELHALSRGECVDVVSSEGLLQGLALLGAAGRDADVGEQRGDGRVEVRLVRVRVRVAVGVGVRVRGRVSFTSNSSMRISMTSPPPEALARPSRVSWRCIETIVGSWLG